MTEYERIKAMTEEELADYLCWFAGYVAQGLHIAMTREDYKTGVKILLKEEV